MWRPGAMTNTPPHFGNVWPVCGDPGGEETPSRAALARKRRKVVLASTLAVDIRSAVIQPAAKGAGIAQLDLDHFHAQFVHLFGLIDLGFFHTDGFQDQDTNIHGWPALPDCRFIPN